MSSIAETFYQQAAHFSNGSEIDFLLKISLNTCADRIWPNVHRSNWNWITIQWNKNYFIIWIVAAGTWCATWKRFSWDFYVASTKRWSRVKAFDSVLLIALSLSAVLLFSSVMCSWNMFHRIRIWNDNTEEHQKNDGVSHCFSVGIRCQNT